jgi:uncharacterized protein DUF6286
VKRRPRRGVPATLTAVVLIAACVVVAVVAIQMLLGETPWLSYRTAVDALHDTRWRDLVTAVVGGVAAVLGLLMVLAAVLPGTPTVLPLAGELDSGASRRSYRSTLRTAASTVDGVSGARLAVNARRASVRVSTNRTNTDGLADAVRDAVGHRLDQIRPAVRPAVRVKVHAARSES